MNRRILFKALLVLALVGVVAWQSLPAQGVATEGKQWAVLIAVQKYKNPEYDLSYTLNDLKALKKILIQRAGMPASHILELSDDAPAGRKPTLANIRKELPKFLAKMGK